MATMTINEMIYKTLTTKMTKEPKYRKELEALGLEIVKNDWSGHYNYWLVRNPVTKRELVINKDYGNRKNIFNPYDSIAKDSHHIQKVDFLGYLNCNRPSYYERLPEESKYKKWREELIQSKRWIPYHEKEIQKLQRKREGIDNEIQYNERNILQYQSRIDKVRNEINELKSRKEV